MGMANRSTAKATNSLPSIRGGLLHDTFCNAFMAFALSTCTQNTSQISSSYRDAHPLEFLVGNLLPIYLGPIITNAHPLTSYFWFAAAIIGTCKGHSGYRIFGCADYHDEHHFYYKYIYGGIYVLDFLIGTMKVSS